MKISHNWLKQFVQITDEYKETAELLTDLGLEVEGIEAFESIKGGLSGIVVGKVISCVPHPNADRLKVTQVKISAEDTVQIVCGAPNVKEGQTVPVATVGTVLFDTEGSSLEIKRSKIRGEVSNGMICAEDEIGLGKSHDGIMVLSDELKAGTPLSEVFEVENDHIYEIGLTPNRSDAMSHWGVARDLKAGLQQKDQIKELITPSVSSFRIDSRNGRIPVNIEDSNLVPRYCGISVSGVKVAESPAWLKNRLRSIGIAPKNNIVDVTNYVMHELGQPLHAFDVDQISGKEIHVKKLPSGTKFITLDGVERTLNEEDLLICDKEKPLALAGVYGGKDSGVSATTSEIFIESAYFDPVSIRKSSKRHGLNTDASFRYERGIDPNITDYALKRAVLLIQSLAGGTVTSDLDDYYYNKIEDFQVFLSFEKINSLVGQNLSQETIKSILASLEIKVNNVTETGMGLTIPAFRVDVQREADVIEEILRVFGYNNIKPGSKLNASVANSSKFEDYKIQNVIASQLTARGFYETMANSLTSPAYLKLQEDLKEEHNIHILNPLSQELSVLRQSLLFSGLETVSFNINRKRSDIKLFEFGKTYHKESGRNDEKKHLTLFVSGNRSVEFWGNPQQKSNFFYLKGIVVSTLQKLGISQFISEAVPPGEIFSEGISIKSKETELVHYGVIKKKILKYFGINQEVLFADFNWDFILKTIKSKKEKVNDISKFQSVRRDFALLLNEEVKFEEIEAIARETEKKLLREINLFDVYQGKNLPEGKKSYAVSFMIRDDHKTLTDKRVDKIMNKLQQNFESRLGAELR